MPIYEYECPKCGRFEVVQKVSARPLKADPECTRGDCPNCAKRLVSAAAFHLKGSGWYKTDYGSSSTGSTSGKSASTSSTSTGSTSGAAASSSASATDSGKSGSASVTNEKKSEKKEASTPSTSHSE